MNVQSMLLEEMCGVKLTDVPEHFEELKDLLNDLRVSYLPGSVLTFALRAFNPCASWNFGIENWPKLSAFSPLSVTMSVYVQGCLACFFALHKAVDSNMQGLQGALALLNGAGAMLVQGSSSKPQIAPSCRCLTAPIPTSRSLRSIKNR